MTEPTKTETAEATPASATVTTTTKPGHKTTEFALGLLAIILTALYTTGAIPTDGPWAKLAAIGATVLTAIGYTVSRTLVKTAAMLALFVLATSSQVGCAETKGAVGRVAGDVVDCMKPDATAAIGELAPAFRDIVKNATGDNGKIDWAPVKTVASPLKSAATRCAFSAVIAEVLRPHPKAGAPQSSALEADPVDVLAGYRAIKSTWGGGTYKLADGQL
jgi:hypothetical protein